MTQAMRDQFSHGSAYARAVWRLEGFVLVYCVQNTYILCRVWGGELSFLLSALRCRACECVPFADFYGDFHDEFRWAPFKCQNTLDKRRLQTSRFFSHMWFNSQHVSDTDNSGSTFLFQWGKVTECTILYKQLSHTAMPEHLLGG